MGSEFDREFTEWGTAGGERKLVKDLDDNHVLNIIGHLKTKISHLTSEEGGWEKEDWMVLKQLNLLDFFMGEAEYRGLDFYVLLKKLGLMPWEVPFKDTDGKKKRFDIRVNSYVEVHNEN